MEVSAIVNSPAQQKKHAANSGLVRSAIGGATIGAAINGIKAFSSQKALLKNGDVYLKEIGEAIEQTSEPAIKEQLQKYAESVSNFVKGGKVNMKAIGLTALKGAAMCALFVTGIELVSRLFRKGKAKTAQPKQV